MQFLIFIHEFFVYGPPQSVFQNETGQLLSFFTFLLAPTPPSSPLSPVYVKSLSRAFCSGENLNVDNRGDSPGSTAHCSSLGGKKFNLWKKVKRLTALLTDPHTRWRNKNFKLTRAAGPPARLLHKHLRVAAVRILLWIGTCTGSTKCLAGLLRFVGCFAKHLRGLGPRNLEVKKEYFVDF